MDREALLERARGRGVNPVAYWIVRGTLQPFFHVYFRLRRIGREHVPATGPVILAANHRSFLDPFIIAVMTKRPVYFVAKQELFVNRPIAWLLGALGAFPIDRRGSDREAMATARAILERGEAVVIFPEGTRIRPGALGRPKRGVGRLALETGAPVVPIALHGTDGVRRGWRIRPHKVRIRAGRPLTFPTIQAPSPALAGAVTDRIWPCIELQWEWLGGAPKLRRIAVVGAGARGAALAAAFSRAGLEVDFPAPPRALQRDLTVLALADPHLAGELRGHAPARAGVLALDADGTLRTVVPADEAFAPQLAGVLAKAGLALGEPVAQATHPTAVRQTAAA